MNIRNILRRWVDGRKIEDADTLENIMYNDQSGAQKNVSAGPALEYISASAAEVKIAKGSLLWIFKSTAGIGYVTMATDTTPVLGVAPGANTFPVFGQQWTQYSSDHYNRIIGTADIHIYIMKDETGYRPRS